MSNRTAEASKAIRKKWAAENRLVLEGKGTRDWTPQQQKDIIEKGKAYDSDGRAFEGHHMKSAEAYPEFQGDPNNIQFLTRAEHKAAHGGDFHNATNGYYDPLMDLTIEFDGELVPCNVIELRNPVYVVAQDAQLITNSSIKNEENEIPEEPRNNHSNPNDEQIISAYSDTKPVIPKKQSLLEHAKDIIKTFPVKHPRLFRLGEFVIVAAPTVAKVAADYSNSKSNKETISASSHADDLYSDLSVNHNHMDESDSFYPEHRASPVEHTVKASGQHYNTKNGRIYKEKDAYQRGGKKGKSN